MAGLFSDESRERVRAASDIVEVIGGYLPLKRAGANFVALCPFHKEKSPSFSVSPHKQMFYCFGCHKGGDVFAFVKEYENIDFPEAVRRLADRAKIPLEYQQGSGEDKTRYLKEKLLQIHEQITVRWQSALANESSGQIARDYLAKRGVGADAVKQFRLGYAPDLWDDTVNWAKSKGHELGLVEKAGLVLRKEGTEHFYDRFRGRLMFPICDEQGRVIGFSGRILTGDEKTAKYVNSPETAIFTKSKVFFGLDKSKRALLEAEYAIICEGQLDLIACFMAGVENIVAPQGTAFTAEHARILKRYVEEVVLCFDSDEAGQNATVRALDSLLASGLAVRVATVPPPHDPDSFIKAFGGEAFKALIEGAAGFFDYYLYRLCATNDVATDKGRLAVLRDMAEAVQKTGNVVLMDTYAQKTALRLGVAPESVRTEFKKLKKEKPSRTEEAGEPIEEAARAEPPSAPEQWLLKLTLLNDDLVPWLQAHLDRSWVRHALVRQIIEKRLLADGNQNWTSLAAFLGEFESAEAISLIAEATAEQRLLPNPSQQIADVVLRLRNQFLETQLTAVKHRANQPELDEIERLELLQRQQELRRLKSEPLRELE